MGRAGIGAGMLTRAERERFAVWAEARAASNDGLLRQLVLVPGGEAMGRVMRGEAAALMIVARLLRSIEDGEVR